MYEVLVVRNTRLLLFVSILTEILQVTVAFVYPPATLLLVLGILAALKLVFPPRLYVGGSPSVQAADKRD
jgi:hypothetical protein